MKGSTSQQLISYNFNFFFIFILCLFVLRDGPNSSNDFRCIMYKTENFYVYLRIFVVVGYMQA